MKILAKQPNKGIMTVQAEDMDDLWYLSQVVETGDRVSGKTLRKIQLKDKDERNVQQFKKPVRLTIRVEKLEFHEYSDILRISGTVEQGPEEIPLGSHHTFNVEPGTTLTINKDKWLRFQIARLDEASKQDYKDILLCLLDRETVFFAILKRQGYKTLAEITGEVAKKGDTTKIKSRFYDEIITKLNEYVARYKPSGIIVASPAFWKEELMKQIKDTEIKKMITLATCNAVGKSAVLEVLKRPEIKNILAQQRVSNELRKVEELLAEIAKQGKAVYSFVETKKAVEVGAVNELLITTSLIKNLRQSSSFNSLSSLMSQAESMDGTIHIINSENEAGKKLDSLGGIGAILRYKLIY